MPDDENGNSDTSLQDKFEADLLAELMGLMSREGISDREMPESMSSALFRGRVDWRGQMLRT